MAFTIRKVDVWAGDVLNRPGTLARLLEALVEAGADLEFLVARRVNEQTSRIFLAPLKGTKQQRAARDMGLVPASGMHSIRIEGPDRRGLGARLARASAAAGINIRGVSAAALGRKSVTYMAFKTEGEAKAAAGALRKALRSGK